MPILGITGMLLNFPILAEEAFSCTGILSK
jgi:hypothetical protein